MNMSLCVNYNSVEERDMDTMFLEAIGTDKGFLNIFLDKDDALKGKSFEVINIELSKEDRDGESDITVIIEGDGKKYGLLIEDKINATAMKEQCDRYTKRGKTGKKNGDYDAFFVFIVCPEKYYNQDEEAKKYEHHVFYEECKKYLETQNTVLSKIWVQQIDQSIEKVKRTAPVNVNEHRLEFFKKYLEYQRENYPELNNVNNLENTTQAGWPHFSAAPKNSYMLHKAERGQFDLTFNGTISKKLTFETLEKYIERMGFANIRAFETGKSMAFRKNVPVIDFDEDFEKIEKGKLDECFQAGCELKRLADVIGYFADICVEAK